MGYIQEPFNLRHRPGVCSARFPFWFTHLTQGGGLEYFDAIENSLHFKYRVLKELRATRTPRDFARMVRDLTQFTGNRIRGYRALVKDPIALMSAEWLARSFGMQVVILIRHPAAFVGSLQKMGWRLDFTNFTKQPLLMEDLLAPVAEEIRRHVGHEKGDFVVHAALLWKVLYQAVLVYQERFPHWSFLRHEDLSRSPVPEFRKLYGTLGLEWTESVSMMIDRHSGGGNPVELERGLVQQVWRDTEFRRDSAANIWNWHKRISADDANRIRDIVGEVGEAFYADEDWVPSEVPSLPGENI